MKLLPVLVSVVVVGVACVTALPNAARVRERRHEDDGDHDDHHDAIVEIPCNSTIVGNVTQPCVNAGHGATRGGFSSFPELFDRYQGVIYRAMIVFGAVAGIILIYVSVRCIRSDSLIIAFSTRYRYHNVQFLTSSWLTEKHTQYRFDLWSEPVIWNTVVLCKHSFSHSIFMV